MSQTVLTLLGIRRLGRKKIKHQNVSLALRILYSKAEINKMHSAMLVKKLAFQRNDRYIILLTNVAPNKFNNKIK